MLSHEGRPARPRAREEGLVVEELADEVIVYDSRRYQAHCLNQTAAMVWKHCDGETTVPEIARRLGRELQTPVREEVVWLALKGLAKNHLLQERIGGAFQVSRREMMKLGVAGAAALPLVTSIIAPTASEAATCVPNSPDCIPNGNPRVCARSSQCCSCCCHTNTGDPADAHCTDGTGGVAGCLPG